MFTRIKRVLGDSGSEVQTVLDPPVASPGGELHGRVFLRAGEEPLEIEQITLTLVAGTGNAPTAPASGAGRAQAPLDTELTEITRTVAAGRLRLEAEEARTYPFTIVLPWETPLTVVGTGQDERGLPGTEVAVSTEVAIARARDRGDLDRLEVRPTALQASVLAACTRLGLTPHAATLHPGAIRGTRQVLPFHQRFELLDPGHRAVDLGLVADPQGVDVVLESAGGGGDRTLTFRLDNGAAGDPGAPIWAWLSRVDPGL